MMVSSKKLTTQGDVFSKFGNNLRAAPNLCSPTLGSTNAPRLINTTICKHGGLNDDAMNLYMKAATMITTSYLPSLVECQSGNVIDARLSLCKGGEA